MNWLKRLLRGRRDEATSSALPDTPPTVAQAPFVAFQPHNDIEQLLMEAAVDEDARPRFQRAVLGADLYAATPAVPELTERRIVSEGELFQFLTVPGPAGAPITAIFTAQERIVEVFGMGVGFVGMRGEDLLSTIADQGAWLNPGFPYSVYWTSDQIGGMLGKPVPRVVEKATQVLLGTPADPPVALVNSLKAVLGRDSRIAEAWFALANCPEDGKSSWYLDIRTDAPRTAVQELLAETFRHADYAGRPLDMIVNKPGGGAGTGIRIAPLQTH